MPLLSFPQTRLSSLLCAGLMLVAVSSTVLRAQTANPVDDGFNPNPNSIVNAVAVQADGKILIGGYFTQLQPSGSNAQGKAYLARLNHDGSVDSTFNATTNGVVRSILLQPSGQILIAGEFTAVKPSGSTTSYTRNYVARLNADGTLDSTFNPNPNAVVYAVASQLNGQIVIGGSFTTVQPNGSSSAVTRNRLARINADGTLDTGFDPNANRPVLSLAVQANGQLIVGGGFSTLQPAGTLSPTTRNCVARLNADGSLDTGFDPEANGSVMAIALQSNGQIVLGGQFTSFQANGAAGATQCDYLGRLNTDGSLDTNFIVNPLAYVSAVAIQGDGEIVIGGIFTSLFAANSTAATSISYAARVNPDGSIDSNFFPNPNQAVNAIGIQSDGEVILGGYFTNIQGTNCNFLARVGTDGSLDSTLAPDLDGAVYVSYTLSNGQRLVGGSFISMGGTSQSYLARINADGTVDTSFAPTVNGPVETIAVQSDGKILLGGGFTVIDGIARDYMARMNPDGSIDGPFNPNPNGSINLISLQTNGQMLVSGAFSAFTPNGATTGTGVTGFARINSDGTIDTTFKPTMSGAVHAIVTQADGKMVIGGEFTEVNGFARGYVARLNSDGTLDNAYDPECNQPVFAMLLLSNGQIVIGGEFTALEPQIAGKLGTPTTVVGPYQTITVPQPGTSATTPIYINYLARLNTDGTLDTSFFPDPSSYVFALQLQSNGQMVVGGLFTSFAQNGNPTGTPCNYLGRINTDGSLDTSFNPSPNAAVDVVQLLTGNAMLIGGSFTALQPNGAASPVAATHMALINSDGSVNPSFTGSAIASAQGYVNAGAIQPNGEMLVGGTFGPFAGAPSYYLSAFSPNGQAAGFNANVNGPVNAIDVLPNGAITGINSNYAVWLEGSGSVRYTFAASSNGQVLAFAQQSNGKVLLGGTFTNFANATGAQYLVRLNADGSVDTTFTPPLNGQVNAIAVQSDGKIIVGGNFVNILASNAISYLARINTDGTLDASFNPAPNLDVTSLAIQGDGKIIVGGFFTAMETAGTSTSTARNYVARINPDGSLDTTFNPNLNGAPNAIVILSSGKIVMGGNFSTVDPNLSTTIDTYASLIRLNADGTLDATFDPNPNGPVTSVAVQADGKYLVGGNFSTFQPGAGTSTTTTTISNPVVTTGSLARINTDGTVDTTFEPHPSGEVYGIAVLANQQVVVVGGFTSFQPGTASYATSRYFLARLNADGTVDASFDPELNSTADAVAVLQDGSILVGGTFTGIDIGGALLIGGSFTTVGGTLAPNLARLNADSTVDGTFIANPDGPVYALTPQTNGSTLVGGSFTHVASLSRSNLARLNSDGSIDATFSPTANGAVDAIATQTDGHILVGGQFTVVSGQAATYLARLSAVGSLDTSFTPTLNGSVNAIAVQPNGQVVVGGSFTNAGGMAVGGIARLNANGTVDTSFNPSTNGTVYAVSIQNDGTILLAGNFTTVSGQSFPYAARVLSNGAIDSTFNPKPNAPVHMILVQADGKVVLGGSFTSVGGLSRYEIARVSTQTPVIERLTATYDESTITWTRSGGAPLFSSVSFEESTDGSHWVSVGQATAVDANTWQLTGLQPAGGVTYYVRATGIVPTSQNSSSGLMQMVQAIDIFAIPSISSAGQTSGSLGTPFSFTVTASLLPTYFAATGLPPGLSINPSSGLISGTPTTAGTYTVKVTAGNSAGSTTSTLVITVSATGGTSYTPASGSAAGRLLDISCRNQLPGSSALTAGFVISGTGTKTVLLRAVGPGLSTFNVAGVMATPELQLYSGTTVIGQNSGWGGGASLAATFAQVGAFALPSASADAALLVTLAPGPYTLKVFDPSGKGGVVLTEVYDASANPFTDTTRLVNISAQSTVSSGSGVLIGGFVISGTSTKSILIRGVGPGLTGFGVSGALADPVLTVFDSSDNQVAKNSSWSNQVVSGVYQAAVGSANIINLDAAVGAFALSAGDTAVVVDLPPGAYTFQVSSASGATGQALGEVYELP